jgi:2'-5' RNA ligase
MTQPEPVHGYTEPEIVAAEEQFDALINAGITAAVAAAVAAILAEPIPSTVTDATFAPIFTLWNAYTAEVLIPELTRVYLGSGEMFLDTLAGQQVIDRLLESVEDPARREEIENLLTRAELPVEPEEAGQGPTPEAEPREPSELGAPGIPPDAEPAPESRRAERERAERDVRIILAYDLDNSIAPLDEPAAAWMAAASNRLKNVGDITWEEIREQLVEGIKAGDGIKELAARVEQAAGFAATRAVKTARTEVASAANGGSITQARALGLDMDKQWEATFPTDGRTRPTHIAAHGQTVDLNDKFVVGDALLDFPADPLGEADETIQCRCAWTAVNIRRRAEVPVVAAVFDEAEHPRDGEGKFAEQAGEDLGVLASVADLYGPIEEELEWGDQTSGSADPVYGWLTVHENGDSALSIYSEDRDEARVILDGSDSSAWTELADRIERVQGMWEDADPEDAEGEDERQLLDGLGTGRNGDIGVGYDKDGLINIYMVDQGKGNFDIWLDGDETESLLETLREAERLIDEAQYEDDEDDVDVEISAAVIHFVEGQHPRDGDGQFADKIGGGGKAPSLPGDKLGLAKRIQLGDGEELRGSRAFDVNGTSDAVPVGAAISTLGGPEVRLGIVGGGDEEKWSAANLGGTLKLRAGDVERVVASLEAENTAAKARSVELRKKFAELDRLDDARDEGRLDAAGEKRRAELEAWNRDLVADDMIGEGVIPAGEWGDLAYQVWGRDGSEADWGFKLAVRPSSSAAGWAFPSNELGTADMDSSDMRRFLKQLNDLAAKASSAPEVAAAGSGHTGAMIALVPSAEHVDRLAVDGGEPAEELHLTVMYLGEAADIPEDIRGAVYDVVAGYAATTPPIEGDGFAVNAFNPHAEDRETALVMGVGGQPLADLHAGVSGRVGKLMTPPDNHAPWVPHITFKYSDDLGEIPALVEKLGPVTFDRLRVAMGDEVTDYPLTGGDSGNDFDVQGWAAGNAGKLRLGQPGGFRRCVKRLRDEPGVADPEGLCATMHHRATGKWPGEGHIVTAAAGEDMPSPEQLGAALAYEEEMATAVPGAHFHTLMHTEGVSTGRRVQMLGSWTWRTPPIPFNWDKHTGMHGGVPEVVTVGLITEIARMGREIHGWGMIDLDDPSGLEYARKLAQGWIGGVSVGADEQPMQVEYVYSPNDPDQVIQEVYHSGNIYEATSSDGMAQASAYVEPLPALIEALAERGIEVAAADTPPRLPKPRPKKRPREQPAETAGAGDDWGCSAVS